MPTRDSPIEDPSLPREYLELLLEFNKAGIELVLLTEKVKAFIEKLSPDSQLRPGAVALFTALNHGLIPIVEFRKLLDKDDGHERN